jgi:choline dehydrogenase-like flavoprotein
MRKMPSLQLLAVRLWCYRPVRRMVALASEMCVEFLFAVPSWRRSERKRRDSEHRDGRTGWFTPEERKMVAALTSLIVPSDENTPGASEMEVLGSSAADVIDKAVSASEEKRAVYTRGLVIMDEMAQRSHGFRFIELPVDKQLSLLAVLDELSRRRMEKGALRGNVKNKLSFLSNLWDWSAAAVTLFPILQRDVLTAFYTSEVSWIWLGYDGPPMPDGYTSLVEPRARTVKMQSRDLRQIATAMVDRQPPAVHTPVKREMCDVVVIGSGAGGAVVAKELGEAGLSVVVLEAGRRFNPTIDYMTDRTDFEAVAGRVFEPEDGRRDMYSTGPGRRFDLNRVKGVGGTTLKYEAMSPRLHESDFRVHSEDGVANDWPINYPDCEPYYTRVENELGVSGPGGSEANPFDPPRSSPFPTPPHPFSLAGLAIKRGCASLGLHFVREPLAIPSRDWNGRPACIGAGTCLMGCAISAKSSMDVTYIPKAERTGKVEVRAECTACEVVVAGNRRAREVVYFDNHGRRSRVRARAIVLAGGAVETPRLLLMSHSSMFPNGLANSSGLVGKYFMEHLAVFAEGLFPSRVDAWRGTSTSGMIQDYYATNRANNFVRGWTIVVTSLGPWPFSTAERIPGWGIEHKKGVEALFGHSVCVASIGEQLPSLGNSITLDPAVIDSFGMPVPHLVNELCENDTEMVKAISMSLHSILEAAGAEKILRNEYVPGGSSHYCGTCRMGTRPDNSVVDAWGRTHDVSNLFIADGSVFVTGGAVNPSLTISALAARTADEIIRSFKRGEL